MFQFTYKLKVSERVKAKCDRHPRYNPEKDGRGGIKGGCSGCFALFDLHQARQALDAAHREFLRRAGPWCSVRAPRKPKQATSVTRWGRAGHCSSLSHAQWAAGPFLPCTLPFSSKTTVTMKVGQNVFKEPH